MVAAFPLLNTVERKILSMSVDEHIQLVEPTVQFLSATRGLSALLERAGRVCYQSEPNGNPDKFLKRIIASGHESVIEHGSVSFLITTDRAIGNEIVRHRIAAYSQESTRFCSYSEVGRFHGISVVMPATVNPANRWIFIKGFEAAQYYYQAALNAGESAQNARALLPLGLKTQIAVTYNLREWRHFLRMRLARDAHPDVRVIAKALGAALLARYWWAFEDKLSLMQSIPQELWVSNGCKRCIDSNELDLVRTGTPSKLLLPKSPKDRKTNAKAPFIYLPVTYAPSSVISENQ